MSRRTRTLKKANSQNQKPSSNFVPILVFVVLVCAGIWLYIAIFRTDPKTEQEQLQASAANLRKIGNAYMALHTNPGVWWIKSFDHKDNQQFDKIENCKNELEAIVQKYADTNDLTKRIAKQFPVFTTTTEQNGMSVVLSRKEMLPNVPGNTSLEVCFVPQDRAANSPAHVFFRREWQAVMISGLEWPDKVLPAIFFHELGHALSDKEGWPTAKAEAGTDPYLFEEVMMHDLETAVLDRASGGQYLKCIDDILDRVKASTVYQAVSSVELNDLQKMDAALGATSTGEEIASVLFVQHVTALGNRWIDRSKEDRKEEMKAKVYYFLRAVFESAH